MAKVPGTVQEWILGFVTGLNEHEEDVLNEQVEMLLEPFCEEVLNYTPSDLRRIADIIGLQSALGRLVPELTVAQFREAVQAIIYDLADAVSDDEYDLEHYDLKERTDDREVIKQSLAQAKEDLAVVEGVLAKFTAACIENDLTD